MDIKAIITDVLVALLVPFLTILAGQLITWIAQWLKKRGLDLSAEQQAKLESLAQKAILAVEEWARSQAKAGIKVPGDVKFGMATEILKAAVPSVSDDLLQSSLNTQLATLRITAPQAFDAVRVDPR